ncbi:gp540 [Yasminevirus sp. GU-2018]|uniref:Gp540 n=1 Tax=Yasminevirus sp. GU-2018 TaxID=2420051 RepID=A0A5K0UB18_9VIRU|nr:gp540 [Yasminevirus sp. GU-2018]
MSNETSIRTTNFMNGVSFKMSALQTLQIVMTSMISGEAQYYRPAKSIKAGNNDTSEDLKDASMCRLDAKSNKFKKYLMFGDLYEDGEDVNTYLTKIVDDALNEDFEGTLQLISKLRDEYMMRLNPQIVLVSALLHKNREKFNKEHPKLMSNAIQGAGSLPTDLCKQFELIKKSGAPVPSIWKRAVAKKLENMSRYHAIKYLNGSKTGKAVDTIENKKALTNLVDLIRITHPVGKPGSIVEELVKTGKAKVVDLEEDTWERLRSSGKTWREICDTIRIPHMALLRNLRNIVQEFSQSDEDLSEQIRQIGKQLVSGVIGGKQFPFRYFSSYRALKDDSYEKFGFTRRGVSKMEKKLEVAMNPKYIKIMEDALEECLKKSLDTIPELKGRVDSLTDNSGSAHGAFVSEYGSVKVAEISNLSAILTAMRATEGGSVWVFGDRLVEFRVDKEGSILDQLDRVNKIGSSIGGSTETGIWLFWEKMIREKKKLDTVFIYSDQQAGYGGLYASNEHTQSMKNYIVDKSEGTNYVDVLKLVNSYREKVNQKMNIFSVQVAGYNNSVIPSLLYRGAVLSGWTGKEAKMASEMIKVWDEIEVSSDQTEKSD